MPGLLQTTRSSSSSEDERSGWDRAGRDRYSSPTTPDGPVAQEYAAASFPGYAEKPLNEQLEPIAVIGMGCRLPGEVKSANDFWKLMMSKGTGQTPKVPSSRFNIDAHYHKNNDRPGSFAVLGGYFLEEDLANFDPGLFNITPVEAMWMDPQQRKLLEVVYEALESGGITLDAIAGTRTAVFAASFTADWQQMAFKEPSFRHNLAATGVDPGIISNRISHVFNLKGPSIVCNTACSSSVYALHNACNALRNNECEAAIVGGVNLVLTVDQHMNTAKLGVLSPTSTCHTFDATADGYGRADAVGAVYIKRLRDAIRDGDPIRAVIRSSATNQNGRVPAAGITHPNREGQAAVIAHAYRRGGDLDPRLTGFFEAHGTGTAVGDPLEVHAISMAMNQQRQPGEDDALMIGAVKTNIGHSEAASGLSALIKAVLSVERGIIPPTRGIVNPSPSIKWDEWQVKAPTEPVPFPAHLPVRRFSVNSFGYGGTNAHIIVEGADSLVPLLSGGRAAAPYAYYRQDDNKDNNSNDVVTYNEYDGLKHSSNNIGGTYSNNGKSDKKRTSRRAKHRNRPFLLPFSAHDKATLQRNLDAHAKVAHRYDLADLSHTLTTRRTVLGSKAFAVASHNTLGDVFDSNNGVAVKDLFTFGEYKGKLETAAFVFTGQGAQWAQMGAELIKYSPVFAKAIRSLDLVLEDVHDGPEWTIEDILLEDASKSPIGDAEFSQPLCTAVQIALVQLLADWGVRPAATVGHSSGEIAAAYAAGLLTAKEAIIAAYYRGQVTRDVTTEGAMLAVGLGADDVTAKYLDQTVQDEKVVVACHNSPAGVTLSGDADAVQQLQKRIEGDGVFARLVNTKGKAYHSHHMAPVAAKYEALVRGAREEEGETRSKPRSRDIVPMVSSVTNTVLGPDAVLDEAYWSRNLRSPVLFNQAVQTLLANTPDSGLPTIDALIEIGPHSALSGPIKQIKAQLKADKLVYIPTLLRGQDSAARLLSTAGELLLRNYQPLNTARVATAYTSTGTLANTRRPATIVDLPPYQWNYTRPLWAENRTSREQRQPAYPRHDVLGQLVPGCSKAEPTWRNVLRLRDLPWLRDHCLGGECVFPTAGYVAMAVEAVTQLHDEIVDVERYVLRDVSIDKALVTPDTDDGVEVLFSLRPSPRGSGVEWYDFSVSSVSPDSIDQRRPTILQHMAGSVRIVAASSSSSSTRKQPLPLPAFPQRASGRAWNTALRNVGFDYGPTFQDMGDIRFDGRTYATSCATNIRQSVDDSLGESRYVLHPATVDSVLQLSIAAIYAGRTAAITAGVVPIQLDELTIYPPTPAQLAGGIGPARGYAWVPRRGVRSFEGSAQITSAIDGQLVLDVVNVRTTRYDAAIPQQPAVDVKSLFRDAAGPYGEVAWKLDFARLVEQEHEHEHKPKVGVDELGGIAGITNLALFRDPALRVAYAVSSGHGGEEWDKWTETTAEILDRHPQTNYTVVLSVGAKEEQEQTLAKQAIEGYASAQVEVLADEESGKQDSSQAAFDIIIAASLDQLSAPLLHNRLQKGGYIITADAGDVAFLPDGLQELTHFGGTRPVSVYTHTDSAKTTSSTNGTTRPLSRTVLLVYRSQPPAASSAVADKFTAAGWSVRTTTLADAAGVLEAGGIEHTVVLADLPEGKSKNDARSLLATATEAEFYAVQSITQLASSLLWVTPGAVLEGKHPEFALVQGLARAVRAEQVSLDWRTVDVDLDMVTQTQLAEAVVRVSTLQQQDRNGSHDTEQGRETEYAISEDGKLFISRLVRQRGLNEVFTAGAGEPEQKLFVPNQGQQLVGQLSAQAKLIFTNDGNHGKNNKDRIAPGHVEVQIQAIGLTREGVLVLTGSDYPTDVSYEIGGVVTAIGVGVSGLEPGDVVVGFNADRFSTVQQVSASLVRRVSLPSAGLNELVGALVPLANAIYGLETLARVRAGDTVLVLDHTGPSGAAALQVAKANGAVPIVLLTDGTSSTASSVAGVEPSHILRFKLGEDLSPILARLSELTGGRGVDVVFSGGSSVDLDLAADLWRVVSRFGRFIDPGRKDVLRRAVLDPVPLSRGASYLAFDLVELYAAQPDVLASLLPRIVELHTVSGVRLPVHVVDLAGIDEAVSRHSEALDAPKTVIDYTIATEKPVTIVPSSSSDAANGLVFHQEASYLLVGCLGGLGRSLTAWMLQHGARRFIFLSRSGADAPSAARLVADLETKGATVTVIRGDVTVRKDVEDAFKQVPAQHPIRGVVHAAMVLRDGLFHSMTYQDWRIATAPKVAGVQNLHAVLNTTKSPLDFFLMTSSVSGILGTPGQANYAAANSFLDAMARHRRQANQVAASIALPMILGVGVVAENDELEEALKRKGIYGIDEEELLQSFAASLATDNVTGIQAADHVVAGLDPAVLQQALSKVDEDDSSDIFWRRDARFRTLVQAIDAANAAISGTSNNDSGDGHQNILSVVKSAPSEAAAIAAVTTHFIEKLSRMLMQDVETFDGAAGSIASYGIDSMVGAELRNWIFKEYRLDIPFQRLLAPTLTISRFAGLVCANAGVGTVAEA